MKLSNGKVFKNKIFITFLLLILNILLFMGFFEGFYTLKPEIINLYYDNLLNGEYLLHNYITGQHIGRISIYNNDDINLNVSFFVEENMGINNTLRQSFHFNSIEINDIVFNSTFNHINDKFFSYIKDNIVFIILNINNDIFYNPIPDSIKKSNKYYFLLSIISIEEYNFALTVNYQTIDKTIYNMANRSLLTSIFFVPIKTATSTNTE